MKYPTLMFVASFGAAMPVWADNGASTEMDISVSVQSSVTCDPVQCVTNDNTVIEPVEVVTDNGKEVAYVY